MNSSEISYRNAIPEDISSVMEIEYSAFPNLICEEKSIFSERIEIFPEGFRIMEVNKKAIGYICSERWTTPSVITDKLFSLGHSIKKQHNPKGKYLYISSMGILKKYHGKGFGKALFEEFIRYISCEIRHIDSIILIVSENWLNARRIYSGNNFKEICVFERFFAYICDNPYYENGIVMRKELLQKIEI